MFKIALKSKFLQYYCCQIQKQTIKFQKPMHQRIFQLEIIYGMLFIQEKKPKLNTQSDSIKAKLFSSKFILSTFHFVEFLITTEILSDTAILLHPTHKNVTLSFIHLKMMKESSKWHSKITDCYSSLFVQSHCY